VGSIPAPVTSSEPPQIGLASFVVILLLAGLMQPVEWCWRLFDAMRRI